MKVKKVKCKMCPEFFVMYNSLRPYCSASCGAKYAKLLLENKKKKEDRDYIAEHKPETHKKEYKKALQDNINKLSRMIDAKFGLDTCIDCNRPFGKQTDAAHYHSRGANSSLKYNLHNLHSARSECNEWSDTHKEGYKTGLEQRYGVEYFFYVDKSLPLIYKEIHLSSKDIVDKLKLVRAIIRNFDTYSFESSRSAREVLNKLIGIYK